MLASTVIADLLEQDPDRLSDALPGFAASIASRGDLEVILHPPGDMEFGVDGRDGFGLLVVEGFVCRIAEVTGRASVEVLGIGDVLRPWDDTRAQAPVPVTATYRALTAVRLAVLDREFAQAVAPWPGLAEAFGRRFLERARWLALQLALTRVRRIEDRLHVLLWHLADRWGRIEADGEMVCAIPLTHDLLAGMIGAQRPTVSTAVGRLVSEGHIARHRDGWLLRGDPPTAAELEGRDYADAFRLRPED